MWGWEVPGEKETDGGDVRKDAVFIVIELKFESSEDECLKCP